MKENAAIWVLKEKTWKKLIKQDERLKDSITCDITDVLAFIGYHSRTTIAEINVSPYFRNTSLSTIKRFIDRLTKAGLIESSIGEDKRERLLSIK